jgi:hypothetical protein
MPANDHALRRRIGDNFLKLDPDSNGLVPDQQKLAPVREKIRQDFATVRARSWVSLWEGFGRRGKAESDQRPRAEAFSAEFEVVIGSVDVDTCARQAELTRRSPWRLHAGRSCRDARQDARLVAPLASCATLPRRRRSREPLTTSE